MTAKRRFGMALLVATGAPALAQTGPAATPPAMVEEIGVFGARGEHDEPDNPALVRTVWNRGNSAAWIPPTEFPRGLLPAGEISTWVVLRLTIAGDDSIAACTPIEVSHYDEVAKRRVSGNPRLGPLGCDLLRKYAHYRHAIDASGQPIASEIVRTIRFRRGSKPVPIVPVPGFSPMPGSPFGWVGSEQYDPAEWPRYYVTRRVPLTEPKWASFLAKAMDLPPKASTGVTLSIAADGTPGQCDVGRSSSDARIDAASCDALMAVRYDPVWQPSSYVPFLVRWNGHDGELVLAGDEERPKLAGPVELAAADRPAGALPEKPVVRLKVWIDSAGKPHRCEITESDSDDAGDAASCAVVLARARFTAPRDAFGEPSPGGLYLRVDWQDLKVLAGYY